MGVVSPERWREIKSHKISSEGLGGNSAKICTSENFPLYGMCVYTMTISRSEHDRNMTVICTFHEFSQHQAGPVAMDPG